MMRVITGIARGRKLETLPGEDVTRPTTESVKEAVFSMIQFEIEDKNVLDLFEKESQVKGTVSRVTPIGIFVTLLPGVEGLIHISKVSPDEEPKEGRNYYLL